MRENEVLRALQHFIPLPHILDARSQMNILGKNVFIEDSYLSQKLVS